MKMLRRNFLKIFFSSLPILFLIKFDLFSFPSRKTKLKKNKNFVWYLNNGD
jgi:hypothetical protein